MNLVELLRSQASRYRCPVCTESMADCDITVLVHQGNHALVRVTCTRCSDVNLLKIVMQAGPPSGSPAVRPEPQFDEPHADHTPPLGDDDILDVHLALDSWDGDLRSLLSGRPAS